MGDYGKLSNFNPEANFNLVRFGSNTPITEMELNESQLILQNQLKTLTQNMWGDCKFFNGGTINLDTSNNNFSVKNQRLNIMGNDLLISKLDIALPYYNTAYLKVWEQDVDKDTVLKLHGNQQETRTVPNTLLDPRLEGIETARRRQLQYDIVKEIPDAKFNNQVTPIKVGKDANRDYNNDVNVEAELFEIYGETYQNPLNLADIRSLGDLQEDGTYKVDIVASGKTILDLSLVNTMDDINDVTGLNTNNKINLITNNYIGVLPNTSYTISAESTSTYATMYEYDKDYKFLGMMGSCPLKGTRNFVTKATTKFIRLKYQGTNKLTYIQIVEGTIATPSEEYITTKTPIYLPCPLERVGDVADKLYYDKPTKKWVICKKDLDYAFSGNENLNSSTSSNGTYVVEVAFNDAIVQSLDVIGVMCNKLKSITANTQYSQNVLNSVAISTSKKIKFILQGVTDSATAKAWFTSNKPLIKYQLATPKIIELSEEMQTQLNALVNQEVNSVSGLKYETDNGAIECKDTRNGVIEDVQLVGRTFNNLWGSKSSDFVLTAQASFNDTTKCVECTTTTNAFSNFFTKNLSCFKPNTDYTIICNILESTLPPTDAVWVTGIGTYNDSAFIDNWKMVDVKPGVQIKKMRTKASFDENKDKLTGIRGYIHNDSGTVGSRVKLQVIVLEGDIPNPPSKFISGLQSVGDDVDNIIVSSVKSSGNLFEVNKIPIKVEDANSLLTMEGNVITIKGKKEPSVEAITQVHPSIIKSGVYLEKDKKYTIEFKSDAPYGNIQGTDTVEMYWMRNGVSSIVGEYFGVGNKKITITCNITGMYYPRFDVNKGDATHKFWDIQVKLETSNPEYEAYEGDKKPQMYKDPVTNEILPIPSLPGIWEGSNVVVADTTKRHSDGKLYWHKRLNKVILNGTETWNILNDTPNFRCWTSLNIKPQSWTNYSKPLINTFTSVLESSFAYGNNHMAVDSNKNLVLGIDLTKLETPNIAGLTKWLQSNNITVVYQTEKEEVYEVIEDPISTFEGDTLVSVDGGAITPRMKFSGLKEDKGIEFNFDPKGYVTVSDDKGIQASQLSYKCYFNRPVIHDNSLQNKPIAYIPLAKREGDTIKDLRLFNDVINYKSQDKDFTTGKYKEVITNRGNGTLNSKSVLKNQDPQGNYTELNISYYDALGMYVTRVERYKLTYDIEGELIGKELI